MVGKNCQVTKTLVSNGCVDYKGNIANKRTTGGWKASPFIIGLFFSFSHFFLQSLSYMYLRVNFIYYRYIFEKLHKIIFHFYKIFN